MPSSKIDPLALSVLLKAIKTIMVIGWKNSVTFIFSKNALFVEVQRINELKNRGTISMEK